MTDTSKPPYPPNWKEISLAIRERAGGRCECTGECGLHPPIHIFGDLTRGWSDGAMVPRRCQERNGEKARWARGGIMLTVAHLNHDPSDNHPWNLKAMCQRCHLRYDQPLHARNAARTRERRSGQRRLFRRKPLKGRKLCSPQ